ncbi:osmoprotectant NAGGN system M42 family peptidase [Caenispirillum bisanense]|uniref:Hydrolase, peptidase M42 family n=1 Tax=Caenispirillum bisanense TaxID=414052 RepID=A0A286GFP1_9PROT|nr:osmoprotectant NAGGN system M42 family peptidase [Caenispirillum bisanense]SOD93949.1 hydrolase, peptidase M42 family [Caenispirillum bisanense]
MRRLDVDTDYLLRVLLRLLETPSPTGMTDAVVHAVLEELEALGIPYELTRRGAIRANLSGTRYSPDRAIIGHIDTLGAIVKRLKDNGRVSLAMIGHWSARFAEGARCTIYSDDGRSFRGTILPLKASGHVYNEEIDTQPSTWENLEVRIDEVCHSRKDLEELGINVGDHVSIDPQPEVTGTGFINSRHLDDKAGVAAILAAAKAVRDEGVELPVDCHLLFTISEEVGVGASHILHGDVAEMVSVDNGTIAPGQNTSEYGATISMQDMSGPFDWYLTRKLIELCKSFGIEHTRDVFRYYRSDAASALEAGNDIRTALLCFAVDGSHGWERTHVKSLRAVASLLALYMQSDPAFKRDRKPIGPKGDFPKQQMQYDSCSE